MTSASFDQLKTAFECISKDLSSVQASLATYEAKMLESERVNPHIKEVVTYYRQEATALRKEMLELCRLMSSPYKLEVLKNSRPSAACPPPAELATLVPAEIPAEEFSEQDNPFNELPA
jgi:hypothetical protein